MPLYAIFLTLWMVLFGVDRRLRLRDHTLSRAVRRGYRWHAVALFAVAALSATLFTLGALRFPAPTLITLPDFANPDLLAILEMTTLAFSGLSSLLMLGQVIRLARRQRRIRVAVTVASASAAPTPTPTK